MEEGKQDKSNLEKQCQHAKDFQQGKGGRQQLRTLLEKLGKKQRRKMATCKGLQTRYKRIKTSKNTI